MYGDRGDVPFEIGGFTVVSAHAILLPNHMNCLGVGRVSQSVVTVRLLSCSFFLLTCHASEILSLHHAARPMLFPHYVFKALAAHEFSERVLD